MSLWKIMASVGVTTTLLEAVKLCLHDRYIKILRKDIIEGKLGSAMVGEVSMASIHEECEEPTLIKGKKDL